MHWTKNHVTQGHSDILERMPEKDPVLLAPSDEPTNVFARKNRID
jgi:hypothetical protein